MSGYRKLSSGGGANAGEGILQRIDNFFEVSARGSTLSAEVRGGVAGWMTTSYILVVNPAILHVASGGSGLGIAPLVTATAASSAFGSLLVGLAANMPFALVPGMGLNAYFTYGICEALGVSYQQALSCGLVAGLMLLLLSLLGACDALVRCILSEHLKKAITAAIGMFQAMIGFQAMGLVVRSPDTLVTVGDLSLSWSNAHLHLALAGLLLIAGLLVGLRLRGSMLVGVMAMAAASWVFGLDPAPQAVLAAPSLASLLQVDFSGWLPDSPQLPGLAAGALVLLFVCLFDVAGVQHGLQSAAGIPMEDRRSPRVMAIAALSTAFGALTGTSPVIVATESSAAIMEGARTGLSAVVMAALFLASAVIAPVVCAVPRAVTAVPLVVVGAFMMAPCRGIAWDDLRVALPSFMTLTVVPFTYSIHNGILAGLLVDLYLSALTHMDERWRKSSSSEAPVELHSPTFHSPAAGARASDQEPGDERARAELDRLRCLAAELLAERAALLADKPSSLRAINGRSGEPLEAQAAALGIDIEAALADRAPATLAAAPSIQGRHRPAAAPPSHATNSGGSTSEGSQEAASAPASGASSACSLSEECTTPEVTPPMPVPV